MEDPKGGKRGRITSDTSTDAHTQADTRPTEKPERPEKRSKPYEAEKKEIKEEEPTKGSPKIDENLVNLPRLETGLKRFSHVTVVESADSADFNKVTVLRVGLYDSTSKKVEFHQVSKKTFRQLRQSKLAWKKFTNKPSSKELKLQKMHPKAMELLTPSTPSPEALPTTTTTNTTTTSTSIPPTTATTATTITTTTKDQGDSFHSEATSSQIAPRRLRKAERILSQRTDRILLVLERCHDSYNQQAVLRTAECLGVQNVWIVTNVETKKKHFVPNRRITRGSDDWLTIRSFETTTECIAALREDGREIWVTDLSKSAIQLEDTKNNNLKVPARMALVIGREADGCSQEILAEADKRVFLPMYGFSDSFNLSVATAMILQRLFLICPEARGDLDENTKQQLRVKWYTQLAKDNEKYRELYAQYLNAPPPPLEDIRCEEKDRAPIVSRKIRKRIARLESEKQQRYLQSQILPNESHSQSQSQSQTQSPNRNESQKQEKDN
jgi:tRNA G18 (ribose-2'-O)-methylase SpoU